MSNVWPCTDVLAPLATVSNPLMLWSASIPTGRVAPVRLAPRRQRTTDHGGHRLHAGHRRPRPGRHRCPHQYAPRPPPPPPLLTDARNDAGRVRQCALPGGLWRDRGRIVHWLHGGNDQPTPSALPAPTLVQRTLRSLHSSARTRRALILSPLFYPRFPTLDGAPVEPVSSTLGHDHHDAERRVRRIVAHLLPVPGRSAVRSCPPPTHLAPLPRPRCLSGRHR